jgi:hypothetical protein
MAFNKLGVDRKGKFSNIHVWAWMLPKPVENQEQSVYVRCYFQYCLGVSANPLVKDREVRA